MCDASDIVANTIRSWHWELPLNSQIMQTHHGDVTERCALLTGGTDGIGKEIERGRRREELVSSLWVAIPEKANWAEGELPAMRNIDWKETSGRETNNHPNLLALKRENGRYFEVIACPSAADIRTRNAFFSLTKKLEALTPTDSDGVNCN